MKPDEASLRSEMEEAEVVPSELFIKLGLLVVESRVPERSLKGRREGPHCPNSPDALSHVCQPSHFLCQRAGVLEKQMSLLWKNHIPMCIEVLMFSQCEHGLHRAHSLDCGLPATNHHSVLLEQWNIQVIPRRHGEVVVRVRELFQALRSYLHFSQISAWLNATHGQAPANIAYRISPPAEFCTSSFKETPECHTFPLCGIGRSAAVKVTVGVLQRRSDVIMVSCPLSHTVCRQPCQDAAPPSPSLSSILESAIPGFLAQQAGPSASPRDQGACAPDPKQKNTGAIPKKYNVMHKSPPQYYHCLSTPSLEPMSRSPELDSKVTISPKVLVSKKSPGQAYYNREDQKWVTGKASKDSDSDQSSPEIDKFLKKINNLEPLSPEEIPTYLASLSVSGCPRPQMDTDLQAMCYSENISVKTLSSLTKLQLTQDAASPNSISSPERIKLDFSAEESKCLQKKQSPQWSEDLSDDLTPTGSPRRSPSHKPPVKRAESPLTRLLRESSLSTSPASQSSPSSESPENGCTNGSLDGPKAISVNGTPKISNLPEEEQIQSTFSDRVLFSIGGDEDDSALGSLKHDETWASSVSSDSRKSSSAENDSGESSLTVDCASPFSPTIPGPGFDLPTRPRVHKSRSEGGPLSSLGKSNALFRTLLKNNTIQKGAISDESAKASVPSPQDEETFRKNLQNSAKKLFHSRTGLPLQSSPAPIKRKTSACFDYDTSLTTVRGIKNSLSCVNLDARNKSGDQENKPPQRFYSTSAPASTNSLLGSFEESILNGRIEPSGVVEGFMAEIGASGSFCPKHLTLPVTAFFFNLSDDNAPSPYLGHISLEHLGKRGYQIPKKGTIQVTLFNPNKTVVKMFVVVYDLSDMPPHCQTFIRQRTLYMPIRGGPCDVEGEPVYLRYLIHLRFSSSKTGKVYLHTDMRVIFARDKLEFDARVANYELRSFTEGPTNPKFSPKR